MKKIILFLILALMVAAPLSAETWCEWSGTEGINCRSDNAGWIRTPSGLYVAVDEENFNRHGYYRLESTDPAIGENQVRDGVVWGFADNVISRTWTVRDLTAEEIDQREAGAMPLNTYYLWKALIAKGVITQQEAAQRLPQELIDAYLARDRLENP
jgi:hypothetical protein